MWTRVTAVAPHHVEML